MTQAHIRLLDLADGERNVDSGFRHLELVEHQLPGGHIQRSDPLGRQDRKRGARRFRRLAPGPVCVRMLQIEQVFRKAAGEFVGRLPVPGQVVEQFLRARRALLECRLLALVCLSVLLPPSLVVVGNGKHAGRQQERRGQEPFGSVYVTCARRGEPFDECDGASRLHQPCAEARNRWWHDRRQHEAVGDCDAVGPEAVVLRQRASVLAEDRLNQIAGAGQRELRQPLHALYVLP